MSEPRLRSWKRRLSRASERRIINPLVRRLVFRGRLVSTYAVLETTGRRSGARRLTPVANGLRADAFWLISAHGHHAHYVHNLIADPHVRVGVADSGRLQWRAGLARPLWDDDARARQRELGRGRVGYRVDGVLLRFLATDMTTIRIDLNGAESL